MKRITIEVTDEVAGRLQVLADPAEGYATVDVVMLEIVHYVERGVCWRGSWVRDWLTHVLGTYWLPKLESDPDNPAFDRVKAAR